MLAIVDHNRFKANNFLLDNCLHYFTEVSPEVTLYSQEISKNSSESVLKQFRHFFSLPYILSNDNRELTDLHSHMDDYNLRSDLLDLGLRKAFIAFKGMRDGHDFIHGAMERGASIFFVEKEFLLKGDHRKYLAADQLWIGVENTLTFLAAYAKELREALSETVIGITGTNGKTSFKEILSALLPGSYASRKNFNNEIGLPFSLLNYSSFNSTGPLILEMGMNHRGEISRLSQIARPDFAVITSIGEGHLQFLESVENVARAKAEIMDGMSEGATLLLHGDSPSIDIVQRQASQKKIKLVTFGLSERNDFQGKDPVQEKDGVRFSYKGEEYKIAIPGLHQAQNTVGAFAVLEKLGKFNPQEIRANLKNISLPEGRLGIREIDGAIWFLDMYNANPASMAAGIKSLFSYRDMQEDDKSRKTVWILGEMGELGQQSPEYHRKVAELISKGAHKEDFFLCIGSQNDSYRDGWLAGSSLGNNFFSYQVQEKRALKNKMNELIEKGDLVFLKGSRFNKLEELLQD